MVDLEGDGIDSMDHKARLSNFKKEALIEEVLKTWDVLAEAEASMKDMVFEINNLKLEIAKLSAVRGVSSTKVEMSERIKELEGMIRLQDSGASDIEVSELKGRVEVLLAALLDLEREVSSIEGDEFD
ncbi:MAG: hypothetical protein CMB45_03530 [Euryarchaeota archaeon]|nr:hypothetical protein [Euryarchaeota archaeon]